MVGGRPQHLQLQLDNCGRENKNHIIFAFAGYIICVLKWFRTVQINFLLVGHTHEDIDRFHSLSTPIPYSNSNTFAEFLANYAEV